MSDFTLDVLWMPGHGGKDPGAVANGRKEKDYTLKKARYCHERSLQLGLRSGLGRRDDVTMDLELMASRVVVSRARVCVCDHINGGGGKGAEVIHSLRHSPKFAQIMMDELKKAGCASHGAGVKTRASQKYKNADGSPKDYYRMHYTGQTETIIVEPGFIDDAEFMAFLDAKMELVCEAELKAACLYLGKAYSLPQVKTAAPAVKIDRNLVEVEYNGKLIVCGGKLEKGKTRAELAPVFSARGIAFDWVPAADGKPNRLIIK